MTQAVVHLPRVAWEGARAIVRTAYSPAFLWFGDRLLTEFGPELHDEFVASRERLLAAQLRTGGDRYQTDVEAGRWRVRLDDLLHTRPDLTPAVQGFTAAALEL
jgi:hypothetical protein